jgi:signal transduction histidine kinase
MRAFIGANVPATFVAQDTSFPRLVSLAAHDLRTPLATVSGFAKTLARIDRLEEPAARYVEMIEAASEQLSELLDELGLVARIESGRYDPTLRDVDTLALAQGAAQRLGEDRVRVHGDGGRVSVDAEATERAVTALARCALRHGGIDALDVTAEGPTVRVAPVTSNAAPVVLGEELRDLGAAVAVRAVRALGGSVELEGETLRVTLPQA